LHWVSSLQTKLGVAMAVFSGGSDGSAETAVTQLKQPTKHVVLRQCTCQRGLQPRSDAASVSLSAGQVIEVLEQRCTDAGVRRFRTRAGWANLHTYSETLSQLQLQQFSADNPRQGTSVLRELQPEEVALAEAKFEVDLNAVEDRVWDGWLQTLPTRREQKAAARERKRVKSRAEGADWGSYTTNLSSALQTVVEADPLRAGGGPRAHFSEVELLAMSAAEVKDGAIAYAG
jgi:hypothetical protein